MTVSGRVVPAVLVSVGREPVTVELAWPGQPAGPLLVLSATLVVDLLGTAIQKHVKHSQLIVGAAQTLSFALTALLNFTGSQ